MNDVTASTSVASLTIGSTRMDSPHFDAYQSTILHKIRALGNAAAHEITPHSDRQLGLAMNIAEHLLKDVYILSKQAEAEFKDES
ncbi:hypothetical protein [Zoogloea sp.]|uniref:hypothetical protein n=1 Tax=Zoogloea sp. TaxID=49181 RepID=UPI0025F655C0|nr:hypothetical protein [Zoogloea sp.]MCK6396003.1 hypothetical protein [Zoogloea sp.]